MTFRFLTAFCLLLVAALPTLQAAQAPISFSLALPVAPNLAMPTWLGRPVSTSAPFAALDLPVTPPDVTASLLLTVFFQEQGGGFLRISWQSAMGEPVENDMTLPGPGEAALSSILCDNFYEGIGMSNQRSLLVPADAMKQAGVLRFQTGAASLGVTSIRMEWLENTVGLTSPAISDVLVTPADGQAEPASALAGMPPLAEDPAWHGSIVNVPVTDAPLRIEQGVDFPVQIDSAPLLARISLKEAGLPWGQHLVVWINSQRAGMVVPTAPSLDDGGYNGMPSTTYVGWREGNVLLPASAFAPGADSLEFSAEPDVAPSAASPPLVTPLAVKDVNLQLTYPSVAPFASTALPTSTAPVNSAPSTPLPSATPSAVVSTAATTP